MLLIEAAYGKAMLRAHGLERTLATLLICNLTLSQDKDGTQAADIAKVKRQPMGSLITRFIAEFSPSDELQERLSHLLALRNDLAHRISDTIIDSAVSMNWEGQVTSELASISEQFADFRPYLRPYMARAESAHGLNDEKIAKLIQEGYPGAGVGV